MKNLEFIIMHNTAQDKINGLGDFCIDIPGSYYGNINEKLNEEDLEMFEEFGLSELEEEIYETDKTEKEVIDFLLSMGFVQKTKHK
jgi:hypothetical protein